MEVQLHIQAGPALTLFNLAINHTHCIASYSLHEAKSKAMIGIDPHTCKVVSSMLGASLN